MMLERKQKAMNLEEVCNEFPKNERDEISIEYVPQILSQLELNSDFQLKRCEATFNLDKCSSTVSIQDLNRLVHVLQRERDTYEQMKALLSEYSTDGMNITAEFVRQLISNCAIKLADDELEQMMADLDPNNSGYISIEIFLNLLLFY
jgi:Ca2+-binding EF-hand superfamily protein